MTKELRISIEPGKSYRRELSNGLTLKAEVDLCVFVYPDYPLQVTITLTGAEDWNGGVASITHRSLNARTATDQDVTRLLNSVRLVPCERCGSSSFDPTSVETNRKGLCERCFTADSQADFERELKIERLQRMERDLRMSAKGMHFRVSAWVHSDCGDDYHIVRYFRTQPSPAQVRRLLKQEGSEILDDFEIVPL